jgi:hypothetical protein
MMQSAVRIGAGSEALCQSQIRIPDRIGHADRANAAVGHTRLLCLSRPHFAGKGYRSGDLDGQALRDTVEDRSQGRCRRPRLFRISFISKQTYQLTWQCFLCAAHKLNLMGNAHTVRARELTSEGTREREFSDARKKVESSPQTQVTHLAVMRDVRPNQGSPPTEGFLCLLVVPEVSCTLLLFR